MASAALLLASGSVGLSQSALVISEFLASNDEILADEDGGYSDWIELYNGSTATVDLAGWFLTDDAGAETDLLDLCAHDLPVYDEVVGRLTGDRLLELGIAVVE